MTCGVANEIAAHVRIYVSKVGTFDSKEWPILAYDKSFSTFSGHGDSGAFVVDSRGRMGGMMTSGSGYSEKTNVTYDAAPIFALLKDMEKNGWRRPNANVAAQQE